MAKKLNSPPVAAPQLSACVSGQEREQPGNNNQSESSLEVKTLNGLENFGVEDEAEPDLFSSDNNEATSETFLSTENNEKVSDDDLEIPAFLRRQKN